MNIELGLVGSIWTQAMEIIFLVVATISGAIFRAYLGFGAAIFLIPVFTIFMEPAQSIVLVTLLNLLSTIQLLPSAVRVAPWNQVVRLSLPTLISIPLGIFLLLVIDGDVLRRGIGVMVLTLSALLVSGWTSKRLHGVVPDILVGLLGGVLQGSTGMGGPPFIIYFLAGVSETQTQRAAIILILFAMTVASSIGFAAMGLVGSRDVFLLLLLLPVYTASTWIGAKLYQRTRHLSELFRTFCLMGLAVVGLLAALS